MGGTGSISLEGCEEESIPCGVLCLLIRPSTRDPGGFSRKPCIFSLYVLENRRPNDAVAWLGTAVLLSLPKVNAEGSRRLDLLGWRDVRTVLGRVSSGGQAFKRSSEARLNSLPFRVDAAACGISSDTLLAVSSRDSLRSPWASGSTPKFANDWRGLCCFRASCAALVKEEDEEDEEDAQTV